MNDLNVKEIRLRLGMTQLELASKIGVNVRTVQNWESKNSISASDYSVLKKWLIESNSYEFGSETDLHRLSKMVSDMDIKLDGLTEIMARVYNSLNDLRNEIGEDKKGLD